jgi:hypothetical protein
MLGVRDVEANMFSLLLLEMISSWGIGRFVMKCVMLSLEKKSSTRCCG